MSSQKWMLETERDSSEYEYHYSIENDGGDYLFDEEIFPHRLSLSNFEKFEILRIRDLWNKANFPEHYLNNKILQNKLGNLKFEKLKIGENDTQLFKIQVPLYNPDWKICLLGNCNKLGNWLKQKAIILQQTDYAVWEIALDLSDENQAIQYKYGIYDAKNERFLGFENSENRICFPWQQENNFQIIHDQYFKFDLNEMWRASGAAVPVFSLRSENGLGSGEFTDLKLLGDWAKKTDLSLIQVLPMNDTTANYSWTDSYPYAGISVYALHPQYLSVNKLSYSLSNSELKEYVELRTQLNELELIDYEKVIQTKWKFIRSVFKREKSKILKNTDFQSFIEENVNWLKPYAVFCVLRDEFKTPDFSCWNEFSVYSLDFTKDFFNSKNAHYEEVMLHAWVQYQLHLQLTEVVEYLHSLGISIKGDLPIGIYRYSVEAWTDPDLFGMDFQAGAPPDEFTDLGQNWGFPTYRWEVMKEDGFLWWKNRFKALAQYFDAMRIDHILGFFRIWRMPMTAVQGILGYFYPAVPVTYEEFNTRHIPFNRYRYCRPFINDELLYQYFNGDKDSIVSEFLSYSDGAYHFKPEFDSQRKIVDYFKDKKQTEPAAKLLELSANVLFLEEETPNGTIFHPRFNLFKTSSYHNLSNDEKSKLYDLYVDYFFVRQEHMWKKNALERLPALLKATDMLICAEDLGLVPDCVPQVLDELAIVALKVQRSPKENIPFYNPKNAGYLNVATYSSHDSSTLRQWWGENPELTQLYYNQQLKREGEAPKELMPDIAVQVMQQHLQSAAMLAIFPIQEFFATDNQLTNPNKNNERINNPAVFPHYWRYRMHISLEELNRENDFNTKIKSLIDESGR